MWDVDAARMVTGGVRCVLSSVLNKIDATAMGGTALTVELLDIKKEGGTAKVEGVESFRGGNSVFIGHMTADSEGVTTVAAVSTTVVSVTFVT